MKNFTFNVKVVLSALLITISNLSFCQKSGSWFTSGSGSSTTWSTSAGGIGITASATNYGSGTSYTLNDFQTNDSMGCNNSAYSDASIVGNPSLSIRHTFPNTAQITFNFSTAVENPIMHFDRLGGGQVSNRTSSSLVTILTPGITYTRLSGNDVHFEVTSTTVGRKAGETYTSLPSECGPPLAGTASGSVRLNGVFSTITFEISMDAIGSTSSVNDRFEIAFSDVKNLTLDFDGVDDYINRSAFLGNNSEVTMMSWIKLDNGFDGGDIMGQRNFRIYLDSNRRLKTFVKTNGITLNNVTTPNGSAPVLTTEMWYHVAAIYDASKGSLKLYLNGELEWEYSLLLGSIIDNQSSWNSSHDFEIGRNTQYDNNYFEGSIYETRVYTKAITDSQLQRQIYQEIENNSGFVRGTVIPKNIDGLQWSDLKLYYKMEVLSTGKTPDESSTNIDGNLHNMRTYQDRTAPLPYVTKSGGNGNWNDANNWEHGDVWDIPNSHTACAIIKISDDIYTSEDHSTIGLIVDSGKELTINGDSGLSNSWYLELNGEIDLEGESQLVQDEDSDLVVGNSGKLEKDQQGTKDLYTYNYWSSPVGVTSMTQNNSSFKYTVSNVMNNGTNPSVPNAISFIGGYDGNTSGSNISIAHYWIWKFANQPDDDYSAWQHVRHTGDVLPGEGFTMKGVTNTNGNVSLEQNYVFIGKPNNGDIELTLNANNDYLVGNPYPSAIDAQQFILDNAPTIDGISGTTGTLYFWEHWGGGSHILQEYQGGYATYNLSGSIPAASRGIVDPDVDQGGTAVGTKTPGRYIPVGQGFFVVGENSGTVKFNNGQRVFRTEGSSSSVFMRNANATNANSDVNTNEEGDGRLKIRLGFTAVDSRHRQILLTVDDRATNDYDWGFDGHLYDEQIDDISWLINDEKYVIQGIDNINEYQTSLPLTIKKGTDADIKIELEALENAPDDLSIYLHDIELGVYHDLRVSSYEINLPIGQYDNRFEIVFNSSSSLSTVDEEVSQLNFYYSINRKKVVVLNPNDVELKELELFNMVGQSVYKFSELRKGSYSEYEINNLSAGTYIVKLNTFDDNVITKKIIIK